jgi:hypothetical protein
MDSRVIVMLWYWYKWLRHLCLLPFLEGLHDVIAPGEGVAYAIAAFETQRDAAARAAVADGVEAPQHGIFKEGVMHMAAFFLCLQDINRLGCIDPA